MSVTLSPRLVPVTPAARTSGLERGLAVVVALLIGARLDITHGMTVGAIVGLALLPVWARVVPSYRGGALILLLVPVAVSFGVTLSLLTTDHPVFHDEILSRSALLVGMAGSLGGLLWCRELLGTQRMAIIFGVGMLLGLPLNISSAENQWRFTYSIPITILLLGLASTARRHIWPQLAVAVGLGEGVGLAAGPRDTT